MIKAKSDSQGKIDHLSRLLKVAVLHRYHNRCVGPLMTHSSILDASHIFPKGKYPLARFLIENVVLQCRTCHEWYGNNPLAGRKWIERYLGTGRYRQLEIQVMNPNPMFRDLTKVEQYLQSKIRRYS